MRCQKIKIPSPALHFCDDMSCFPISASETGPFREKSFLQSSSSMIRASLHWLLLEWVKIFLLLLLASFNALNIHHGVDRGPACEGEKNMGVFFFKIFCPRWFFFVSIISICTIFLLKYLCSVVIFNTIPHFVANNR